MASVGRHEPLGSRISKLSPVSMLSLSAGEGPPPAPVQDAEIIDGHREASSSTGAAANGAVPAAAAA